MARDGIEDDPNTHFTVPDIVYGVIAVDIVVIKPSGVNLLLDEN